MVSVTNKALSRLILNRMAVMIETYIRKEQAGPRKGKSCADKVFS